MFPKVVALILCLALVACAMLALRQQRIQAAHELAKAQARLAELDRNVLRLRLQIASRLTPDRIEQQGAKLGRLMPLSMERYEELVRLEAEEAGVPPLTAVSASR